MPNTLLQRSHPVNPRAALMLCAAVLFVGCDDTSPTTPGTSRFGQVGVVEMTLTARLTQESGRLEQRLRWTSAGAWRLSEEIFYRGESGDATVLELEGSPNVSAGVYAQWIAQVNEAPGLDLFEDIVDPTLDPDCPLGRSRVTLRITDESRGESIAWTRCAPGSLGTLTPTGSGPDAAAARVVNASVLLRDYTVGRAFQSAYRGSLPFATLARGEDAPLVYAEPVVFRTQEDYAAYWGTLSSDAPPPVDFATETVFLAAVGIRNEAGDSVEVRRIVPVETGTLVEIVERIPGNFCSPAARRQAPYHLVVAPGVSEPVSFTELRVERVPCG